MAIDGSGEVHISYYDATNKDLKYAKRVLGSWNRSVVDSPGTTGRFTDIAVDAQGKSHMSYVSESGQQRKVKYATNLSGTWSIEVIETGVRHTSIDLDADGKVYISHFLGATSDLRYVTNVTGAWADETLDGPAAVGQFSSIKIRMVGGPIPSPTPSPPPPPPPPPHGGHGLI